MNGNSARPSSLWPVSRPRHLHDRRSPSKLGDHRIGSVPCPSTRQRRLELWNRHLYGRNRKTARGRGACTGSIRAFCSACPVGGSFGVIGAHRGIVSCSLRATVASSQVVYQLADKLSPLLRGKLTGEFVRLNRFRRLPSPAALLLRALWLRRSFGILAHRVISDWTHPRVCSKTLIEANHRWRRE